MITTTAANALRMTHENAVWAAIQSSGEGNPPSSSAGSATAAAMNAERAAYNAYAANPTSSTEAAFLQAHANTAARFQAWKGRPIDPNASNLTPAGSSSSSSTSAGTIAGVSVPLLLVGGAALWYFMRKRKKGGKKKFLGIF